MADFFDVCKSIQGHTLITPDRLWCLWSWVNDTIQSVPGDIAELGSYKGGSAKLLSKAINNSRAVHVFDTFEGVPTSLADPENDYVLKDHPHLNIKWSGGVYSGGEWAANYESVKKFLGDCPSITLHRGMVPDVLEEVKDNTFCFVHLDMDIWKPTWDALNFFWTRMPVNGIIMLDDYDHLAGINKAVDLFLSRRHVNEYEFYKTAFMQCALRKK
jgi:O-methyltransferase